VPLPPWLGRFNRTVTNRVTRLVAGHLPGFGIVVHVGRRSGRRYRTPVNAFRRPGGYAIALTYGEVADWIRNVRAAGGCELERRGRLVELTAPRVVVDRRAERVPPPVRPLLRLIGVDHFLELDLAGEEA
jgi:deazaflavin-dependent oxidoreductase (nitroreductase family)